MTRSAVWSGKAGSRASLAGAIALWACAGCQHTLVSTVLPPDAPDMTPAGPGPLFVEVADPCISTFTLQLDDKIGPARESMGSGVAIFDYDGDGNLDVILGSQTTPSRLCRNRGDGTFEDVSAAAHVDQLLEVRGFAVGDFDNDGDEDLYVTRGGPDVLLRNDGGVFTVTNIGIDESQPNFSAAFCDFDGDGKLDLIVGEYSAPVDFPTSTWANRLYRNTGGAFVEMAQQAGMGVAGRAARTLAVVCTDYDKDGKPDIYEVNDFGMCYTPNRLWHNDGGMHFTNVAPTVGVDDAIYGMSAVACDYDNDLDVDLFASNVGAKVLRRNDGGMFTDVARQVGAAAIGYPVESDACSDDYGGYGPPWVPFCGEDMAAFAQKWADPGVKQFLLSSFGAQCFDADGDGWQDLAMVNSLIVPKSGLPDGWCQPNTLLRNSAGTFTDTSVADGFAGVLGDQMSIAVGDLDGDGDLDVVVTGMDLFGRQRSGGRLLMNQAHGTHYLALGLQGTASNRDGIGARVEIAVGARHMMREVQGNAGFASANPHEARFGLGDATVVDDVMIYWPSGKVDHLKSVAADRVLKVIEGSSP